MWHSVSWREEPVKSLGVVWKAALGVCPVDTVALLWRHTSRALNPQTITLNVCCRRKCWPCLPSSLISRELSKWQYELKNWKLYYTSLRWNQRSIYQMSNVISKSNMHNNVEGREGKDIDWIFMIITSPYIWNTEIILQYFSFLY